MAPGVCTHPSFLTHLVMNTVPLGRFLGTLLRTRDKLGLHLLCPQDRTVGEGGRTPDQYKTGREVMTQGSTKSRTFREQFKKQNNNNNEVRLGPVLWEEPRHNW